MELVFALLLFVCAACGRGAGETLNERAAGAMPVAALVPVAVAVTIDTAELPIAGERPRLAYDADDKEDDDREDADTAVDALAALNEYVGCDINANDDADPIGGERSESAPYETAAGRAVTERAGTVLAIVLWLVVVAVAVAFVLMLEWLPLTEEAEAAAAPVKETVRELLITKNESNEIPNEHYCRKRHKKQKNKTKKNEELFCFEDANMHKH